MRLFYAQNITFDELPHIESAILAVSKVKSMYRDPFPGIINLGNMLADCGRPGNKSEDAPRWQLARLIERIKSYEVMLVLNYYEKPMLPLFTLQADASHPRGGTWQVTDRRDLGASRLAILLRNVRPSHRSLVQAARAAEQAAAAAPRKAAEALQAATHDITLNVRHEQAQDLNRHLSIKDGTRYTLTTDRQQVREGVVQKGRVEEKDLEMSSGYTLVFFKPT